jgi:hypothetical protein
MSSHIHRRQLRRLPKLDVPRSWLQRSKKGLWYCPRDIPLGCILGALIFTTLARSPVEEPPDH